MSERMIELQRARLLNVGKGAKPPSGTQNGTAGSAMQVQQPPDPQQTAAARVRSEDELLQSFLQKLQNRDDSRAESQSGPTVPTSLSRRMLQRQGVGYLDPSVGAIVSAAADRFLVTVLQQSLVCRDQRLKGAEQAKEAAMHRKRHLDNHNADRDDRERRKADSELQREARNLAAIEAAETLTKEKAATAAAGATGADDGDGAKAKKRKTPASSPLNGSKRKREEDDAGQDDDAYDSMDEEEDYYQAHLGSDMPDFGDEIEDEDDMLILRDILLPLQAWNYHVNGKEGYVTSRAEEEEDEAELHSTDMDAPVADTSHEEASVSKEATNGITGDLQDLAKGAPSTPNKSK